MFVRSVVVVVVVLLRRFVVQIENAHPGKWRMTRRGIMMMMMVVVVQNWRWLQRM
jgi:hypothetical protein